MILSFINNTNLSIIHSKQQHSCDCNRLYNINSTLNMTLKHALCHTTKMFITSSSRFLLRIELGSFEKIPSCIKKFEYRSYTINSKRDGS